MKLNCFRFFEPFGRPLFIALRSYDQNTVMETNSSLCLQSTTHFVWILLDTSYAINHTTLNQIHNLIYVAKKIFSRYMDNAVCLYSLVQCPKAIDNQNPQSRFLRIEKSTSSNWGPGSSNSILTNKFEYIYTHALHEVVPCHSQCYLMLMQVFSVKYAEADGVLIFS